jgi:outer membrane protein OmpA-like peptidoglycan-associated protein
MKPTRHLNYLLAAAALFGTTSAIAQDRHSVYPFEATEYEPSQFSYGVGHDTATTLIKRPVQKGETQWVEMERAPLRTASTSSKSDRTGSNSGDYEFIPGATVFFAFDSAVPLNPEVISSFQFTADTKVRLIGRTDPIGTNAYNDRLAYKRAAAVASLFEQNGMLRSQMDLVSLGARSPIAPTDTEAGRQKNRQVLIELRKQ